jgi:hypothetical protein
MTHWPRFQTVSRGVFRVAMSAAAGLVLIGWPVRVFGDVKRFEVRSSREVSGGRSFGSVGPYEEVTGRLYFEVDPSHVANRSVVDIDKARKNGNAASSSRPTS